MDVKTIQKYKKYTLPQLQKKATEHFNKFIRLRDQHKGCVSCDSNKIEHASHFYSSGGYPSLRFNENNVHGSCLQCNYFFHGNLIEYRKRITQRISEDELKILDFEVLRYKQTGYKWDKIFLIETIIKYKKKLKEFY